MFGNRIEFLSVFIHHSYTLKQMPMHVPTRAQENKFSLGFVEALMCLRLYNRMTCHRVWASRQILYLKKNFTVDFKYQLKSDGKHIQICACAE